MKPFLTLCGKEFNLRFKSTEFIKLTTRDHIHHDFPFQNGLNVDVNRFNPRGKHKRGGIYFIDKLVLARWLQYSGKTMHYVWEVHIPDDAQVYIEENGCFKADKINMKKLGTITEYLDKQSPITVIRMFDKTAHKLRFVKTWNNKTFILFILTSSIY